MRRKINEVTLYQSLYITLCFKNTGLHKIFDHSCKIIFFFCLDTNKDAILNMDTRITIQLKKTNN